MATIDIDGVQYQVEAGDSLLPACLGLGLDLPYFCWHPALGAVGACRQCAIVQYQSPEDVKGRLVMACMTPVVDGLRISLQAEQAQQFRRDNIELLMTNHPHDCPVCEEGGECHLQDMTLMSGHTVRRYRGRKRTHQNQDLGPFINHEMNRCIACYRCVRFYGDYAGGSDLQALGMHNNVYFGRFEDGALENEFSGNLVEVCPTGVFTDRTFSAHYTRKWDLQTAPSVCVHCGLGCNTAPGERYGELRRIINRYNGEVNGYFLCDRGRFGYGFVNSPARILQPSLYGRPDLTTEAAEQHLRSWLDETTIGIGSPRASLEANFALRSRVGEENFFLGLDDTEHSLLDAIVDILRSGGIRSPSLCETEQADAVLILGEDPSHSAPRLALALRQAVRNAAFERARQLKIPCWLDKPVREQQADYRSPLFIASVCATRLDDVATATYRGTPEDIARLGFAIAHCLNSQTKQPEGLPEAVLAHAATIADRLKQARRPLVVSGTASASLAVIEAAYNVAKSLPAQDKQLTFTVPECNSLGLALMGGQRLRQAFERAKEGGRTIILENDLYRRAPAEAVDAFLQSGQQVAVLDYLKSRTTEKAALVLPAAPFSESDGTLVNNEGRAQRYFQVYPAPEPVRSSWQWLFSGRMDVSFDTLTSGCAEAFPELGGIVRAAPDSAFTVDGMKIPRQPHRYSGRTAMRAHIQVSELQRPADPETPFAFSMEGATADVPAALEPVIWAPGWNSNQAIGKFQEEIGGHLRGGDYGVRLIESVGTKAWFEAIPDSYAVKKGQWRLLLLPHIFASEELSFRSLPVAERSPSPKAMLNSEEAATLAVQAGDLIEILRLSGESLIVLPVHIEPTLPSGVVALLSGQPEALRCHPDERITLRKTIKESAS